jgi:hypothetical protein
LEDFFSGLAIWWAFFIFNPVYAIGFVMRAKKAIRYSAAKTILNAGIASLF